jgi:hypothetical protein
MGILRTKIIVCLYLCVLSVIVLAQDKVILKNGKTKIVHVVSITEKHVTYRDTADYQSGHFNKSDVFLIERKDGRIYLLSPENGVKYNTWETESDSVMESFRKKEATQGNHLIGTQPFSPLFGRFTLCYEYQTNNKRIGVYVPLIGTFNAYPKQKNNVLSPGYSSPNRTYGFMTGLDINFYFANKPNHKLFIGPRVRYGYDYIITREIFTGQFQVGIMFNDKNNNFPQHISFGTGFISLQDVSPSLRKQLLGWGSINYRFNFRL